MAETSPGADDVQVDILIGADYYWNFITNITRRGNTPGPVDVWSKLGWVLSGPVVTGCHDSRCAVTSNLNSTHVLQIATSTSPSEDSVLVKELSKFWELETLGVAKEEPSLYDKFTQEINFNGERYEANLPFKEEHPILPDNYTL